MHMLHHASRATAHELIAFKDWLRRPQHVRFESPPRILKISILGQRRWQRSATNHHEPPYPVGVLIAAGFPTARGLLPRTPSF